MAAAATPHKPRDSVRETVETLVFVVVLVLMMKLFVVDAYVIPTGSMAETLFGYKKVVTCEECGHTFEVNASRENEAQTGPVPIVTVGYCCPNCRFTNRKGVVDIGSTSGDRVIVGKFLTQNDRGHVVVFKYPVEPQKLQVSTNYIKRLVGLENETIAIHGGDLYVTKSLMYDPDERDGNGELKYPRPADANDLWRTATTRGGTDYTYPTAPAAAALFDKSRAAGFTDPDGFQLVRKSDELAVVMRRLVYDNDHQSKKLAEAGAEPRWSARGANDRTTWSTDNPKMPKAFTHIGEQLGWIRYQHLLPEVVNDLSRVSGWENPTGKLTPHRITNFIGYNSGFIALGANGIPTQESIDDSDHWVGDLILECTATATSSSDSVVMELSKGTHRFRAEFQNGQVRLKMFPGETEGRRPDGSSEQVPNRVPLGEDTYTLTAVNATLKSGANALRFANIDGRLRVWINEKPIDFGEKASYPTPDAPTQFDMQDPFHEGWTMANDINEPASLGAAGSVVLSQVKLWRDNFYVNNRQLKTQDLRNPLNTRPDLDTFYVQPGHYLCMGDNSAQSSDGRMWGLVPQRLMLGRAVFVFLPVDRIGFIK